MTRYTNSISKQTMRTFIGVQQVHHFQAAVFQIPTSRGEVFMYEELSSYMNSERAVVEVDAEKFLNLWRQPFSSHPEVANGTPQTWPNDSKFHWPDEHFMEGLKNPVPLAQVSCRMVARQNPLSQRKFGLFKSLESIETIQSPSVHFTDGVTRTIWLLTFGAERFPVECPVEDAPLLQKLAGVSGGSFTPVDQLVPL